MLQRKMPIVFNLLHPCRFIEKLWACWFRG